MGEINVIVGRFGSGKTEFALNMALKGRHDGKQTFLADLDLINPYFTCGIQKEFASENDIKLSAPSVIGEECLIAPDVYSLFDPKWDLSVLDVGGDPTGARVLGQFYNMFNKAQGRVKTYYLVNTCRPMSSTADEICEYINLIESVIRIKVDFLVNNANLGMESHFELLLKGDKILRNVIEETGINVRYIMGTQNVLLDLDNYAPNEYIGEHFVIDSINRPLWIDLTARASKWKRSGSNNKNLNL